MKLSIGIVLFLSAALAQKKKKKGCDGVEEPTSCSGCRDIVKCIKKADFIGVCEGFGFVNKKSVCDGDDSCDTPTSCTECKALEKVCLKDKAIKTTCKKFSFSPKKPCPAPCADSVSECAECVDIDQACFKKDSDLLDSCQDLGYNVGKDKCLAVCPAVENNCAECIAAKNTGLHCVTDKKVKAKCKTLKWDSKKNTCLSACPVTPPATCDACNALEKHCLAAEKKVCKPLCKGGGKGDKDACEADTPDVCQDCKDFAGNKDCLLKFKKQCKKLLPRKGKECPGR